ncbi:MAG: sulfite exporter TauE/SafE family protein [Ignavibacteriaceae bacterium]|nr:sulfite exporter TauE/SafE family protein [Ignavibacteriaceae bacterium]
METLSGLALGFLGSLHCIGMCGPIALALPSQSNSKLGFYLGRVLYNLGRVLTYSVMGLIIGLIGQKINLAGYQQIVSIVLGIIILVSILLPARIKSYFIQLRPIQYITQKLQSSIGALFKKGSQSSLFAIGVLNGFLPCGFVYVALAGAVALGSIGKSIVFMALFGLGTAPAMFSTSIITNLFGQNFRRKVHKAIPVFASVLAVIFILRGLNLGIPYLSPKMKTIVPTQQVEHSNHDCCE